ncbi:alpha/beta hydrolase [uncultured Tolumonas sp.]|uniref:alpha/beta hydrolase n=1 Tax=uncultured Tolumonas sp. TaxID=263765 RepID=UPI00374A8882
MSPAQAGLLRERLQERFAERHAATAVKTTENDEFTDTSEASNSLPAGVRVIRNLAYGTDAKQRLDVYLPTHPLTSAPVIFMVHGGAWRTGDKAMSNVVDNKIARWVPEGIVFISINYRLLPQADPLLQAQDVATALAYAQKNATRWGADAHQFVLMGHSAGAHLVSLLAADPTLATRRSAQSWLGTVSLDSAAYDIPRIMAAKHYRFYDKAFGSDPAYWQAASPSQQLKAQQTAFLAICSTQRPDKPCDQAGDFVAQAKSLQIAASLQPEPLTHKEINKQLGLNNAYTQQVETFLAGLSQPLCLRIVPDKATQCSRN